MIFFLVVIFSWCVGWYAAKKRNPFMLLGWLLVVWLFLELKMFIHHLH